MGTVCWPSRRNRKITQPERANVLNRSVDYVARRLYEAGCRYAFGMPGGEVLTLVDALEQAGIEFVLCKHENAAGFVAEGTFHRTGAPGVLVATIGPGLANATNVIANASQDRVPLIVLSGCVDDDEALTYTHQVFDHRALLDPLCKATYKLTAHGADIIADRAVTTCLDDQPGPVLIDIPIRVAEQSVEIAATTRRAPMSPAGLAAGADFERAVGWLNEARRPLVVAGLDVMSHAAEASLRALIEQLDAPLITTYKAKGVVAEDHNLALGGAGLSPLADEHLLALMQAADVILAVGYDPIEMRSGWRNPWDSTKQKVIELATCVNTHYMHQATVAFVCNLDASLRQLADATSKRLSWPDGQPQQTRAALRQTFSSTQEWGPADVIETCRRILPCNTLATVDSGAHRILLSQMWTCYEPRTLLQSTGLCTMGCALPLALGAKIADASRPVVAFTGDAGLLMVMGELATVAERNCPLIVVVFVDASLALIEMKQRSRQFSNTGVDFKSVDFAALASAFGGHGETVNTRDELEGALHAALESPCFTVIACAIDRQAYDGAF